MEKKEIFTKLNNFYIIKIDSEVYNFNGIYLKYLPIKLFNRIVHSF